MELVANAHPSSSKCELIAGNGHVHVIANALISKLFLGRIKLFQIAADNYGTISRVAMRRVEGAA
jgi:hypothetical protein